MADTTKFDKEKAQRWISDVSELKDDTNAELVALAQCLSDINSESQGPFVDVLFKLGGELTHKFAALIDAVDKLITAFKDVISKLESMVEGLVDGLVSAASKMMGGISL